MTVSSELFYFQSRLFINTLDDLDQCPICKSSKYLSPNLKFLVNPECYHKICENCVDRLFSMGPAQCPYDGCTKILRKNKFKEQIFEDLIVEREVDVRQRVSKTFNKRQDDFENLKDFNNYLEDVENIIFNLVNSIDVEKTEEKLQAYEQKNKELILANSRRQKDDDERIERRSKYEKERKVKAMQLEVEMAQVEREVREEAQREYLEELANSNTDPNSLKKRIDQSIAAQVSAKRKQLETQYLMPPPPTGSFRGYMNFEGNGLDPRDGKPGSRGSGVASPFTPFMGDYQKDPFFVVSDEYFDPVMESIKQDPKCFGSGYIVEEAYKLDLSRAFFGIGCFIGKEKA